MASEKRISLKDFEFVRKIGQGGFGAVWVVRKKDTGEVLALKIVNKSLIWKKNKVTQMKNERDVLASHLNAWMVQLAYSFQDPHYCYLAMEFCPGGDLRHLLTALGYLEEHEVRLYMAEMILAVFSLHSLGYIHRDLKPDNFLIDSKGHLKLTDFGLSKDGSHSNVTHRRFAQANSLPELSVSSSSLLRPDATPKTGSSISRIIPSSIGPHHPPHFSGLATPLFEPKNINWNSSSNRETTAPHGEMLVQNMEKLDLNKENSNGQNQTFNGENTLNSEIQRRLLSVPPSVHHDQERTYSVVGSPHYMSPEVLSGEHGYGAEVDWWSLGCIFFEFVTGSPPFDGETPQHVFDNIINWRVTLPQTLAEYSDTVSPECLDFISKLFLCDAKERFNAKMGLARVFAHPFFKDFTIESIFSLEPPFIPQLKDECDTTYFDISTEDRVGTVEEQEREKMRLLEELGNLTPPTPATASHPIQCPQTAPRRLTHSSKFFSPEDYSTPWADKTISNFTPLAHAPFELYESSLLHAGSHSHRDQFMFPGMSNASPARLQSATKNYGRFTIQRTRALGTFTPLRRRMELDSPKRDIAGFTFQRKKSIRGFPTCASSLKANIGDNLASSSGVFDFTSDEAIMRYATARRSPDHFFGSPGSGSSNDFSTHYITPRALNFEVDVPNPPSPST